MKQYSDEELDARRARVEKKMYWARHEKASENERKGLEGEWNEIRKEQTSRQSPGTEWTYKHDRRDEWHFERRRGMDGWGEYTDDVAKGTVHPPESTINWRSDTVYGKSEEDKVRSSISKGTGDDAGHLARAEWGADPEGVNAGEAVRGSKKLGTQSRSNYGLQNPISNRHGFYHKTENGITAAAEDRGPLQVEVSQRARDSRFDGSRPYSRKFSVKDQQGNDLRFAVGEYEDASMTNISHANTVDHSKRDRTLTSGQPGEVHSLHEGAEQRLDSKSADEKQRAHSRAVIEYHQVKEQEAAKEKAAEEKRNALVENDRKPVKRNQGEPRGKSR